LKKVEDGGGVPRLFFLFYVVSNFELKVTTTVRTASKNVTAGVCFGGQECFGILGNLS
jgi:hypothetical protein